ncbi:SIR2 family protein [Thauera humireducens]|uniref:SIR2 family protein n=1 Tax=Thauera humireducens TaxID=1134435 RepID=UPI00311ECD9B
MIKTKLEEIFKNRGAGPFLFVGSGFSRRYLGLEDWKGLLSRFCVAGRPFEYYLASANGDYPLAARLLAEDFNKHWWSSDEYKASVERYKGKIANVTSALRIEICSYLSTLDQSKAKSSEFAQEVELLSGLNVDGVITTNWDTFIEQLFPDYRKYIGQNELLFSNPQEIGEIYKIHGCSTLPESLVLTNEDYTQFNERNAYLAAKLITIFVEHPVVFLGYSLSDQNVSSLLRAISLCIGKENIEQLRQNLIFIQRQVGDEEASISDTYITIDGVQIPLVLVKSNDWTPILKRFGPPREKFRQESFATARSNCMSWSSHPSPRKSFVSLILTQSTERRMLNS